MFERKPIIDEGQKELVDKTEQEIKSLTKKYQENPELIVNDYDEMLKTGLIGIIANIRANGFFRTDIIENVVALIRLRKFVVNQYSNSSSNNGSDKN